MRKLEIDNEKLRQTIRQKLDIVASKSTAIQKQQNALQKHGGESRTSSVQDEFYEMVREGFVEQMQ